MHALDLLLGHQAAGHLKGVQEEDVNVLSEEEADQKANHQSEDAGHEPRTQLDQVIHQRRARGLDLGFVVVVAHAPAPLGGAVLRLEALALEV